MFSRRNECDVLVHGGELLFAFGNVDLHPVVRFNSPFPADRQLAPGRLVSERTLERLLDHSRILVYRFERFEEVPISAAELDWQDRTGVSSIRFEPGSSEEQYWLGRVSPFFAKHKGGVLPGLLYAGSGFQLQVDTTAIADWHTVVVPESAEQLAGAAERGGHWLGNILSSGYHCKLRGNNTLVIKPQPEAKW